MKITDLQRTLSPKKAIIPVAIGLAVVIYLFSREYDINEIKNYDWGSVKWVWLVVAALMLVVRHFGYMYRIRVLTEKHLNWSQAFNVTSIWELASSISPSAVGGTAVSMFILVKEKISLGRSTAIALSTLLLDLLFFIIFVPVFLSLIGRKTFFGEGVDCIENSNIALLRMFGDFAVPFLIAYGLMLAMMLFLGYGLFKNPKNFKHIIVKLFQLPFLRKWKQKANDTGNEVILSSKELSTKSFLFWIKAFFGTCISWVARFALINCLVLAFSSGAFDHVVLFSRYFLLWAIMVLPSTPGASGVAELSFSGIFCQFLPTGAEPVILVIWRLMSYYFYVILGLVVLPRWLASIAKRSKEK